MLDFMKAEFYFCMLTKYQPAEQAVYVPLFEALAHLEQKPQEFHHPFVQLQLSCSVIATNELIEDGVHVDYRTYTRASNNQSCTHMITHSSK